MQRVICLPLCFLLIASISCSREFSRTPEATGKSYGSALVSVQWQSDDNSQPDPFTLTVQVKTDWPVKQQAFLDLSGGNAVKLFPVLPIGKAAFELGLPGENTLLEITGTGNLQIQEDITTPLFITLRQQQNVVTARLHAQGQLVLWCTFEDDTSITHPEWGPGGIITGGSFLPGKFGNCYTALHNENFKVSFPGVVITANRGCIEFWARLEGYDSIKELPAGAWPWFFRCNVKGTDFGIDYHCGFLHDNGRGGGGLCFNADNGSCSTGSYESSFTLESILGTGVNLWHHYAVCWDITGIPGKQDRIMIFLDGKPHGTSNFLGRDENPTRLQAPQQSRLEFISNEDASGIAFNNERVFMDNLKIWNYAKTDFSGRERETL